MYLKAENLNLVYEGLETKDLGKGRSLIRRELGELSLPSGRIIACDPITSGSDYGPFSVTVPPGRYPGAAYIYQGVQSGMVAVALAALFFNDQKAVRWEMALTSASLNPDKLGEDDFFGYPVDAGTGGFLSVEASDFLEERYREDYERNQDKYFMEYGQTTVFIGGLSGHKMPVMELVEKFHDNGGCYGLLNEELEGSGGLNLLVFSSGLGDGRYPSYFGYDSEGRPSCLVTDFLIIDGECF